MIRFGHHSVVEMMVSDSPIPEPEPLLATDWPEPPELQDVPLAEQPVLYAAILRRAYTRFVVTSWSPHTDTALPRDTALAHWDAFAFNTMQLGHNIQLYQFPDHVDSLANPTTWALPHRWGLTWFYPHGQEAILLAQADASTFNPFRREPSTRPALARGVEFVTSQGHTRAIFVRVMHNAEEGAAARTSTMFAIKGAGLDCTMRHLVSGANRAMHTRLRTLCRNTAFAELLPLEYKHEVGGYSTWGYLSGKDADTEATNYQRLLAKLQEMVGAEEEADVPEAVRVWSPIQDTLPVPVLAGYLAKTSDALAKLHSSVQSKDQHVKQLVYVVLRGESVLRLSRTYTFCLHSNPCFQSTSVQTPLASSCPLSTTLFSSSRHIVRLDYDQYRWLRVVAPQNCAGVVDVAACIGQMCMPATTLADHGPCRASLQTAEVASPGLSALTVLQTDPGILSRDPGILADKPPPPLSFLSSNGWQTMWVEERQEWLRAINQGLTALPVDVAPFAGQPSEAEIAASRWLYSLWADLCLFVRLGISSTGLANSFEGRNFVLSVRDADEWGPMMVENDLYGFVTSTPGDLVDAGNTALAILRSLQVSCESPLYMAVARIREALFAVAEHIFDCPRNAQHALTAPCQRDLEGVYRPYVEEGDEVLIGFAGAGCALVPVGPLRTICEEEVAVGTSERFVRGPSVEGGWWPSAKGLDGANARLARVLRRVFVEYIANTIPESFEAWRRLFAATTGGQHDDLLQSQR